MPETWSSEQLRAMELNTAFRRFTPSSAESDATLNLNWLRDKSLYEVMKTSLPAQASNRRYCQNVGRRSFQCRRPVPTEYLARISYLLNTPRISLPFGPMANAQAHHTDSNRMLFISGSR
jgi:hypothetical protein